MASRTYLPTLLAVAHTIIKFVARYRPQINKNLSEDGQALLDALIAAAEAMVAFLEGSV